jgi:glycosyltransferase involved in cell wall biosynthesis
MNKPIYLYITPFFPSPKSWRGGYCLDAVKAIIRDGRYDVRVMVIGNDSDYIWDDINIACFRKVNAPSGVIPFLFKWINNNLFIQKIKSMSIDFSNVAVCHVNTLDCGHYASCFKKINPQTKTIIQMHSSYSLHLDSGRLGVIPFHATLLYLYYRKICMNVDVLAFVSKMSRDTFGMMYDRVPEGHIDDVRKFLLFGKFMPPLKLPKQVVVYNGIDSSLFSSLDKKSHRGFVIGCVANFQPLKDHLTLLRSVNILKDKIKDFKVRFIGSGIMLDECKQYVKKNSLDDIVSFEKEMDHRELPGFYQSLDLFVLPSRLEGFVCVCVESWACGTPSIICNNISLSELIAQSDYKKWLFKPMDAEDLAAKILAYKENKWKQHFTKNLEINTIWRTFLDDVASL